MPVQSDQKPASRWSVHLSDTISHIGLRAPAALGGRLSSLFNLQCWVWGWDARHATTEGNLLLSHGFERSRPPTRQQGSSAYTIAPDPATAVVLWGFGCYLGIEGRGGVFLSRQGAAPRLAPPAPVPRHAWAPADLPSLSPPSTPEQRCEAGDLLGRLMAWIGSYEEWIVATLPEELRRRRVESWGRCSISADELAPNWRALTRLGADVARPRDRHARRREARRPSTSAMEPR
jgi:hypothetical protein